MEIEKFVWKFLVNGEEIEVIADAYNKRKAMVELGKAVGVNGCTKKSILNEIYKLKPELLSSGPRLLGQAFF